MAVTGYRWSFVADAAVDRRRCAASSTICSASSDRARSPTTYAGLGLDRGLTVGLRSHLTSISGYQSTHHPGRRAARPDADRAVAVQQRRAAEPRARSCSRSITLARRHPDAGPDRTPKTRSTRSSACSTPSADGRYLFSGRAVDQPPVDTTDHILNGDGAKAGLKQVIDERKQADLGAERPRPAVGRRAERDGGVVDRRRRVAVRLQARRRHHDDRRRDRQRAGRLAGRRCRSISAPTNPNAGDTVKFSFKLPDGTTQRPDADGDDVVAAGRRASSPSARRRRTPRPISRRR